MTIVIYATEIPNRPPRTWAQTTHAILYFLVFNLGCLIINASQFVFLLPLRFLPLASTKSLYHAGIRLSEGAFGTLLSKPFPLLGGFHRAYSHVQFSCANGSHLRVS